MTGTVEFSRAICGNYEQASRREWLVTNGTGGYASGTISGSLTRRYHGYLIAALQPPLGRTLLLTRLDETAVIEQDRYPLFTNAWANGVIEPDGYRHIERFRLEGTTPVWTFALREALLEKRIWMLPGANTTCIQYRVLRPPDRQPGREPAPIRLEIKAIVNHRDYHGVTEETGGLVFHIQPLENGLRVSVGGSESSLYLHCDRGIVEATGVWYQDYFLRAEAYRGEPSVEDHYYAGLFRAGLQPGDSLTLTAGTEERQVDPTAAFAARQEHEADLLHRAETAGLIGPDSPAAIHQLVLAADAFVVRRASPQEPDGSTVLAGYPWFSDWGRDTMISLPGLTLATGRPEVARSILRTYAGYVDRGMLPNRFPDQGEQPEYNTVDAALWYFEALRAYHAASGDGELLQALYPALEEIISHYIRGTRNNIHVDSQDGLLYSGESGVQLTWMDAKVGDWVVTPRTGKAVEVNALWYNALHIMADFTERLGRDPTQFRQAARTAGAGFERFWNPQTGTLFDVLDGPGGNDPAVRPNALFAAALPYSPLSQERARSIVATCARYLLTSHGLRSLAPQHPDYVPRYGGDRRQRDGAYHQGTVWGWLIGPFVRAHLRAFGRPEEARSYLLPLLAEIRDHGLGSLSEIFDGEAPYEPRGCIAQAWTVAEVLNTWQWMENFSIEGRKRKGEIAGGKTDDKTTPTR